MKSGANRQSRETRPKFATFFIVVLASMILFACSLDTGPYPPGTENDWAQDLASAGAASGLSTLLEAADIPVPEFLITDAVGLIMGKIFKGGTSPDQEILDSLSRINTTLQAIENELAGIETQLTQLENALQIDTSTLDKEIRTAEMDPYINQIDTLWNVFRGLYNPNTQKWDTNPKDLSILATDILDLGSGVYPQLVGIHNLLTGEGNVSGFTLDAMMNYATALILNGGTDPFASYMMIENYFGSILQAQTHGATLMVEALKYRESNPTLAKSAGDYLESATYFMDWYSAHIEDQVEVFLAKTEQLIAKTAYPQKGFSDFVPKADKILYRADLIAAWMSSRHRLDPAKPANGQEFMVYRVIGGPDRVAQYGNSFVTAGTRFSSILYNPNGSGDYDVPKYSISSHHANADLRPGVSPYVQFMHPLDTNGGAKQKGAISDATEIWTGCYITAADSGGNHWYAQPYYLSDIPGRAPYELQYQSVNSAGGTAAAGENQILFGYVFDMEHPPAMLMGDWSISRSHNSTSGLNRISGSVDGGATPGSQWTYLNIDAWPNVTHDQYWYYPTGSFQQENAMVGYYYWGGTTGDPVFRASYDATIQWEVDNNGSPADRSCGTLLWLSRADQSNSYGDYDYHNQGTGTDSVSGSAAINMVPGQQFYISLGAHMFANWQTNVNSDNDWHHWEANYAIHLNGLTLTLPH